MKYYDLAKHFQRFIDGVDRSVQWAKDAETLLDTYEQDDDELLDEIQDLLAVYRPEGGDHLIDEIEMLAILTRLHPRLNASVNSEKE